VASTVAFFAVPVAQLAASVAASATVEHAAAGYASQGVPAPLARKVAALDHLACALDVAELAGQHATDVEAVAEQWNEVGDRLRLDWLGDRVVELPRADRWDALARNALREDIGAQQRRIVDAVMTADSFDAWATPRADAVARVLRLIEELRQHAVFDVATLSVALRELRGLG